jgi:hypothetical protein
MPTLPGSSAEGAAAATPLRHGPNGRSHISTNRPHGCAQLHSPEAGGCRMLHGSEAARYDKGGPNERSKQDNSSAAENSRGTAQGAATDRFSAQGSSAVPEHETGEADSPGRAHPLAAMGRGTGPLPVSPGPQRNSRVTGF